MGTDRKILLNKKYMKFIVITLMLLCFYRGTYSQVQKFKAFEATKCIYGVPNPKGTLKWIKASMLVVFNLDKEKVLVYSEEPQEYDIVEYTSSEKDKLGNTEIVCKGVNKEGIVAELSLTLLKHTSEQLHVATLIVRFEDMFFAYRLKSSS